MRFTAPLVMALLGLPLAHAQAGGYDIAPTVPRFTLAGEYNYIRANAPPSGCECFSLNGANVQGGLTLRYWLRAVAEVGFSRASSIGTLGQNLTLTTYMGGPQVVLHGRRAETFAQALIGGAHGSDSYFPTGTTYTTSASSFAYKLGGGFDYSVNHTLAVRVIEIDYLHTGFPNAANNSQNHLVIGAGVVLHLRNSSWTPDPGSRRRSANRAIRDGRKQVPEVPLQAAASVPAPPRAQMPAAITSPRASMAPVTAAGPVTAGDDAPVTEATFHAHVKDALFDYDSDALRPDAQQSVEEAAAFLRQHPSVRVLVGGYSDERTDVDYNVAMGEKRAAATRDALVLNGIAPERIELTSYGGRKQVCAAEDEDCLQLNRRASLMLR